MANLNEPHYDEPRNGPGFTCRRARIGRQLGAERLGASLFDVPPGQAAYPYHYHLGEEELLVILAGRPSMRTPGGWRELEPGDVLCYPVGEEGPPARESRRGERPLPGHQHVGSPGRRDLPRLGEARRLRAAVGGGRPHELFRRSDAVDYLEGEEPPG